MNAKAILPMESYRLAQYAVPVPCFICEGDNAFDSEYCRHCFAPMALSTYAAKQKTRPKLLATLGSSGTGKTVYLGTLMDMLSRQADAVQLVARGAFSITLQQRTIASLSRCIFPEKTASEPDRWNWVNGTLRMPGARREVELVMPDMAGEAILEEIDHPHSFPVVQSMLAKSAAVLLLVDTIRVDEGGGEQDFFAMKILSHLSDILDSVESEKKSRWKKNSVTPPVALVFTKADQCDICFDDPIAYARKHTPGLWQLCQERFRDHQFFAAGVAGACGVRMSVSGGRQRVPLRVEPRGIVAPFRWLVERIAQ